MAIKPHPEFKNCYLVEHPLVQHKLTHLREVTTRKKDFQELVKEITLLLAYEATKDLPLGTRMITTPLEEIESAWLIGKNPVVVPILRAGVGMVESFLTLIPTARVGHIGLYRDESSLEPQQYYCKIPKDAHLRQIYLCDPMLATGGSANQAIEYLKRQGCTRIVFICLVAAPEGLARIASLHPDVKIFMAALDRGLNEHGYILPGLGDAGDRMFGTK